MLRRTGKVELVMIVGRWSSITTTRLYLRLGQALQARIEAMTSQRTRDPVQALVQESRALCSVGP